MNNHVTVNASPSPFKGLMIDGQPVKPGMVLIKPHTGMVVISGAKIMNIGQGEDVQSLTTLKLHQLDKLDNISTPPINKIEANRLRLPAQFDEIIDALDILVSGTSKKPKNWKHQLDRCNDLMMSGKPADMAQLLLEMFSRRETSSENTLGVLGIEGKDLAEKALKTLANEAAISIDFKKHGARKCIFALLDANKTKGKEIIDSLQKYRRAYNPFISDQEFQSAFGKTVKQAMIIDQEQSHSTASLSPSLSIPSAGEHLSQSLVQISPSNVQILQQQPVKKRLNIGATSSASRKRASIKKVRVSADNRAFFETHKTMPPKKGVVRKLFNVAAEKLGPQAFELHARMYCFPEKLSLESAAEKIGATVEEARDIHNQSVEQLRPHFGDNGVLKRVPGFLKQITSSSDKKTGQQLQNVLKDIATNACAENFAIVVVAIPKTAMADERAIDLSLSLAEEKSGEIRVDAKPVATAKAWRLK